MESRPGGGAATGWSQRLKSESPTWLLLITDGRRHPGSDETTFNFHSVFSIGSGEKIATGPAVCLELSAYELLCSLCSRFAIMSHLVPAGYFHPGCSPALILFEFPSLLLYHGPGSRTHTLTEARPRAAWRPQNNVALNLALR